MRIYLSGISGVKQWLFNGDLPLNDIYALESFYSMQEWEIPLIPQFKSFILDSGAFTFLNNQKRHQNIDWIKYADNYADFIKDNHIKQYFELDIDSIKDLSYVEMLRKRIESRCGIQSIPVWHKNRGLDYFVKMCKEYPYVALGGVAIREISIEKYEKAFPWFIKTAHDNGCKIHGLGYTRVDKLNKYHFDSIDSTTWTSGGRYGEIMQFNQGTIIKHRSVINGVKMRKIKDVKMITLHNFNEWVKFQRWADKFL